MALLQVRCGEQLARLGVMGVVGLDLLEQPDRPALVLLLDGELRRREDGSRALEGVDPAAVLARLAVALDGSFQLSRLFEQVSSAEQVAGLVKDLSGAAELISLLEQLRGKLPLLELGTKLGGLDPMLGQLVVIGGALGAAVLLMQPSQEDVGELGVPVSLEGA